MTPISVIGNQKKQAGFSLIEVLVVLVILSISFGMISVSFFNTDQTEWQDVQRRLIVSLNQAKDESTLSGAPIVFQIDRKGWRFLAPDLQDKFYILGDALAPYSWNKQTVVEGSTQFTLEATGLVPVAAFKVTQGPLTTIIHRRRDGYFEAQ